MGFNPTFRNKLERYSEESFWQNQTLDQNTDPLIAAQQSPTVSGTAGQGVSISGTGTITTSSGISVTNTSATYGIVPNTSIINSMSITGVHPKEEEQVEKTDVRFIVVLKDDSCMELQEQNGITPREVINICKFINVALLHHMSADVNISWSGLILSLGIDDHFITGEADYNNYDNNTETLNIFLFDSE